MQFARALSFYFLDDKWFRKLLALAACQFIPILGLAAATGWALEICRRAVRKDPDGLPALSFRRNIADGFAVWGIALAYSLPGILLPAMGGLLSAVLFPAGEGTAPFAFDSFWWGIEFLAVALFLAGAMGAVAAIGRFADAGSLRAAFRFRSVISAVRSNPLVYLRVVLIGLPMGLLAFSGIAVCGAGMFFTTAYALGSWFHLTGQAHLPAAEKAASGSVPGRL